MEDMHSRLRQARIKAGFNSRREATDLHGWTLSSYGAHENGQNDYNDEWAIVYAKAFKVSAQWLLFGTESDNNSEPNTHLPDSIDAQLAALPPEYSKRLIEKFNTMIEGVRTIGKIL
jgi:hypothetical protein